MEIKNQKIVIAPGVFFNAIGDEIYLRNVDTKCEYILNSVAGDVFSILRNAMTFDDLMQKLSDVYNITDFNQFSDDIKVFVSKQIDCENILLADVELRSFKGLNLIDHVQEKCTKLKRLWNATFELTYRCNEKCIHCYLDDPGEIVSRPELSFIDYKNLIDQLADLGCMNVLVTGGEPTLHKDFLPICGYIVERGMLLDIFTNALTIKPEIFDALCGLNVNSVSFSLYGVTPEFHDSITQIKGSFEKSFHNILLFKSAGFDVYVKTVLFKNHFGEYLGLRKLFDKFGIAVAPSTIITPGHSGKKLSDMMLDEESFRELFRLEKEDRINKQRMGLPQKENLFREMNDPICSAGNTQLSFNPFGDVFPCNAFQLKLGNVKEDSIKNIWEQSKELKMVRNISFGDLSPECKTCKYSGVCNVCLGAAYAEHNGKVKPCSYTCNYAKMRYEEAF